MNFKYEQLLGEQYLITKVFAEKFDNYYVSLYKNKNSLLASLCDKYGSDKGEVVSSGHPYSWLSHTYTDYVERLFDHCRYDVKNVFECGLGTNNPNLASNMTANGKPGASLRVWKEYFPNAQIIGVDIDKDILFEEDRIKTFYCDQMEPSVIKEFWSKIDIPEFDLMVDDGLHTFEAGRCLFENSFYKLKTGGIYIIEDITFDSLMRFETYFADKDYKYEMVNLYRKTHPLSDNSLIVIRKC